MMRIQNQMAQTPRNIFTSQLKVSQRMTTVGHTGSGKSYLMRNLLELAVPRHVPIIIFDGKSEYEPTRQLDDWEYVDGLPRSWEREVTREKRPHLRRLIVRMFDTYYPNPRRNYEPMTDLFDRVWYWAGEKSNKCILYIDEIQTACDEHRAGASLHRLLTMGRVRDIGVWAGSQRPSLIPRVFLSEADHLAAFRLFDQNDRDRTSELMGQEVKDIPGPGPHDFWYRGPGTDNMRPFLVHQSDSGEMELEQPDLEEVEA